MEEDIKILEKYISEWNECLKGSNVGNLETWKEVKKQIKVNQAIINLIARYKEVEMQNKELLLRLKADGLIERDKYWINKVKEKIEEWDESIKWANADDRYYAIKILKELLED